MLRMLVLAIILLGNILKYMTKNHSGGIYIPAGRKPWPHEMRVANILAANGYRIEFIKETSSKSADIFLDNLRYEIKSPITSDSKKIIRNLKRALDQSPNVIIDSSRIKNMRDNNLKILLSTKAKNQPRLKRLLLITKKGQIIDIFQSTK